MVRYIAFASEFYARRQVMGGKPTTKDIVAVQMKQDTDGKHTDYREQYKCVQGVGIAAKDVLFHGAHCIVEQGRGVRMSQARQRLSACG